MCKANNKIYPILEKLKIIVLIDFLRWISNFLIENQKPIFKLEAMPKFKDIILFEVKLQLNLEEVWTEKKENVNTWKVETKT